MIATVAVVIGASSGIFVALYDVLLRQLPFADAGRLVVLWEADRDTGDKRLPLMEGSYPIYRDRLSSFEGVAAFIPGNPNLPPMTIAGTGDRINGVYATPELFALLGGFPSLGRPFSTPQDRPGAADEAILSYRFWKTHFGGSPDAVGRDLELEQFGVHALYRVIGVMPPSFEFPRPLFPGRPDVWLGLPQVSGGFQQGNNFYVIGKLKRNVVLTTAQADLDRIAGNLSVEHPRAYGSHSVRAVPLQIESLHNSTAVVAALVAAFLFVTLIGCANIVHLVMARAVGRQREVAIRLALGASRLDLFLLTSIETGAQIAIGGALGLLIAVCAVTRLPALLPGQLFIPRAESLTVDMPLVLFVSCLCLAGALALGFVVSRRTGRQALSGDLRAGAPPRTAGLPLIRRPGSILLVCEIAFGFALAAGAFVMLNDVRGLLAEGAVMNAGRQLTLDIFFSNSSSAGPDTYLAAYDSFVLNVRAIRGVKSVALVDRYPLDENSQSFTIQAADGRISAGLHYADFHTVTPGYYSVAQLRVVEGRWLDTSDARTGQPVAVINEAMARRYFSSGAHVGMRLRSDLGRRGDSAEDWQVVGVVQEPRRFGTGRNAPPAVYVPLAQAGGRNLTVVVSTETSPRTLAGRIRDEALHILPGMITVNRMRTGTDILSESTARTRFLSSQLTALGIVALILASFGTYSIVSFNNSRRAREMAVRIAVGGTKLQVIGLVVREAMLLVGIGIGAGILLADGLVRVLTSVQEDARPVQALPYLAAGAVFCCVGLIGALLSALRVASADPIETLRAE